MNWPTESSGPGWLSDPGHTDGRSWERRLRNVDARLADPFGLPARRGPRLGGRVIGRIYTTEQVRMLREMSHRRDLRLTALLAAGFALATLAASLLVPVLIPPRSAATVRNTVAMGGPDTPSPEVPSPSAARAGDDSAAPDALAADASAGLRAVVAPIRFAWATTASR